MADRAVVVIGVGNELRGDDGVGLAVARRLREDIEGAGISLRESRGEASAVLDLWDGHDAAVIVDAMRSGAPPGTVRRLDASTECPPSHLLGLASTHALGLDHAVELGRAIGRLPGRVIVYGIEGWTFELGAMLSAEVDAAIPALADAVLAEAVELARG